MGSRRNIAFLAFLLACATSVIATFGFILESNSELRSTGRDLGIILAMIGEPGFILGFAVTGGHQSTATSIAVSGTLINLALYFLVWAGILKTIQLLRKKPAT